MDTSSNRGKRFIRLSFRLFSSKLVCTILFVIVASHNTSLSMPLGESYMSVTAATPASLPLESRRPYYQRLEEEFMSSNVIAAIEGVRTQRSILMGEEAISNEVTPHFYLNEAIRYFLKQRLQSEIKIDDDDTILSKKITSRTPRVSQETRRDDFDKMLAAADAQQLKAYKRSLEDAIQQLEEEDR